jgi:putative transposase
MKKARFSEEQIVGILKQHEAGMKTVDLCRQHNISAATFYALKAKYGGLEVNEAQELKRLKEENSKLKRVVADLTLDNVVLKDLLEKTGRACGEENGSELHDQAIPDQRTPGLQACGNQSEQSPVSTSGRSR